MLKLKEKHCTTYEFNVRFFLIVLYEIDGYDDEDDDFCLIFFFILSLSLFLSTSHTSHISTFTQTNDFTNGKKCGLPEINI